MKALFRLGGHPDVLFDEFPGQLKDPRNTLSELVLFIVSCSFEDRFYSWRKNARNLRIAMRSPRGFTSPTHIQRIPDGGARYRPGRRVDL